MASEPASDRSDPEQVLAHDQFVRGLARHLLKDVHGAEDVAQQTWVAALQRPPVAASLRGWLAAVVRRLALRRARGEGRELSRQRAAARQELVPSTAEIVAREALRAEVVRAVLELDESHRAIVLLRFFDHLPPRAIARRLSVPVETVRTRLKRALALLRARLDRHCDGGRAAWCALLLPYAGKAGAVPAAAAALQATFTGVVLMTSKAKFATLAATLGGILLVALWTVLSAPPSRGETATAPAAPTPESATAPPAAAPRAEAASPGAAEREAVAAPAPPTTGSLLVHAVWGDDKTPAPDVLLELYRVGGDSLFDSPRQRSGADGSARFTELAPGRVFVQVQRGDSHWGGENKIVAGQQLETTIEIEAGMNCKGIVVDGKDRPIGGADVLVTGWTGGEALVLARTAADGTFALRALGTHCHVGASAPGYSPSPMRQFTAGKGAEVELRIVLAEPGAALSGVVLDPQNHPVAGAVVRAGSREQKMRTLPDGGTGMAWQPQLVRTDAVGRFSFASVEPGKLPLAVRARGLAPWHQDVELQAERPNEVTVRLLSGVTLVGSVRDAAGAAVAGVEVNIGDWDDIGHRRVPTAVDGTFRADGLAPG
jgi:RNA polymerase sigma-70 factor (ECF subfamily)